MNKVHTIQSEGFSLKVIEQGVGETLLIIGSADYYQRSMPESFFGHYHCVFVDHRGFAACHRKVDEYDVSLAQITQDIERVCCELNIRQCWILGHSGHAYMALDFTANNNDRIKGTILVGASPCLSKTMQALQFARWEADADENRKQIFNNNIIHLESDIQHDPERKFVHLCCRLSAMRWFDTNFDERFLWNDVPTHTAIFDKLWGNVFAEINILDYTTRITSPVLIISGSHDFSIAPPAAWLDIQPMFKSVEHVLINNSGHTPMLEQPEAFDKALQQFLKRNL